MTMKRLIFLAKSPWAWWHCIPAVRKKNLIFQL